MGHTGIVQEVLHRHIDLISFKPGINGPVYQCHPLMREFLRARAKETLGAVSYAELIQRAAQILEAEGSVDAAIRLLVQAGDPQRLLDAILHHAGSMLSQGRVATLERWLDALPAEQTLRLPMQPKNRSLNLSNAAAIVVYEAWRQIGFVGGS